MSLPMLFLEPPTLSTLASARVSLEESLESISSLSSKIKAAEESLAQIVAQAQSAINEMIQEKTTLQDQISQTRAYLSPIRRLPVELLREIFKCSFERHPCCAWVLAAVCGSWRRLALSMPTIWAKVRMVTTPHSSPDTIRLWLERAGPAVPLDIEIYLRVASGETTSTAVARRHRSPSFPVSAPQPLILGNASHMVLPSLTQMHSSGSLLLPQPIVTSADIWGSPPSFIFGPERLASSVSSSSSPQHWGHIAVYYLVQQMHRWERFVFRYDKPFKSVEALRTIAGAAPLLKHFEVSCALPSGGHACDWGWLATSPPSATSPNPLPALDTLTLQHVPFKPTSPLFLQPLTHLHTINLRASSVPSFSLDRILAILSANASTLKTLRLYFGTASTAVLPLNPTTLGSLQELSVGGNHLLSQLIETLILPSLRTLDLDLDALREPVEETIVSLLTRSANPLLVNLSIAYTNGNSTNNSPPSPPPFFGAGNFHHPGAVTSWAFLSEFGGSLESLKVGGSAFDSIVAALSSPDENQNNGNQFQNPMANNSTPNANSGSGWLCPNLRELSMRSCRGHTHHHNGAGGAESVGKLVRMVGARNPEGGGSGVGAVRRLKKLDMEDCVSFGDDVVKWLEGRVGEVTVSEPAVLSDRPSYYGHTYNWGP